jgi:hypothetical protein
MGPKKKTDGGLGAIKKAKEKKEREEKRAVADKAAKAANDEAAAKAAKGAKGKKGKNVPAAAPVVEVQQGRGHKTKGAGTVQVSKGPVERGGVIMKDWQKLPSQLVQEYVSVP